MIDASTMFRRRRQATRLPRERDTGAHMGRLCTWVWAGKRHQELGYAKGRMAFQGIPVASCCFYLHFRLELRHVATTCGATPGLRPGEVGSPDETRGRGRGISVGQQLGRGRGRVESREGRVEKARGERKHRGAGMRLILRVVSFTFSVEDHVTVAMIMLRMEASSTRGTCYLEWADVVEHVAVRQGGREARRHVFSRAVGTCFRQGVKETRCGRAGR